MTGFDLAGFREAVTTRDADRWLAFYAPDAEWREYRDASPPRAPRIMSGREAIGEFLRGVMAAPIEIAIENEVLDERRAAFTLIVTRDAGHRIIENVVIEHRGGRIVRQIDVEAWD